MWFRRGCVGLGLRAHGRRLIWPPPPQPHTQAKREEKQRLAAEKQAKRDLAKKLKFSKRH